MDLRTTIRELYEEKQRIEEAIASLEELLGAKGRPAAQALDESPRQGTSRAEDHVRPRRGAKSPAG